MTRTKSSHLTNLETRGQPFGPPLIGALLRAPWEVVQRRMLERMHEGGFDEIDKENIKVLE